VKIILFNLAIIIVLEYLVLLLFFRKEYWPSLQFSALMNAITLSLGLLLFNKLGMNGWAVFGLTIAIEAVGIYFFWIIKPAKALGISIIANTVSSAFFPIMIWLGVNLYPF
jgi:hypothetical protein